MAAACPAARAAAAAAGARTSRAGTPPAKRRRIPSATSSSPRAKARVRTIRSRGRPSPGAAASKISSTCSAQSAAHAATVRLSASLSVCGERIRQSFQPQAAITGARLAAGQVSPRPQTRGRAGDRPVRVRRATPRAATGGKRRRLGRHLDDDPSAPRCPPSLDVAGVDQRLHPVAHRLHAAHAEPVAQLGDRRQLVTLAHRGQQLAQVVGDAPVGRSIIGSCADLNLALL